MKTNYSNLSYIRIHLYAEQFNLRIKLSTHTALCLNLFSIHFGEYVSTANKTLYHTVPVNAVRISIETSLLHSNLATVHTDYRQAKLYLVILILLCMEMYVVYDVLYCIIFIYCIGKCVWANYEIARHKCL